MRTITFGCWLRSTREKRGLTQADVGRALGTHARTISVWECGKQVPGAGSLLAIASWARVSPQRLGAMLDAQSKTDPLVAALCARLGERLGIRAELVEESVRRTASRHVASSSFLKSRPGERVAALRASSPRRLSS